MSKQCKIVEDLLPLYHDGICSQESREMVDAHLKSCKACQSKLTEIDGELLTPTESEENLKPLRKIRQTIRSGRHKSLITGAAISLAVIVLLFAAAGIIWYSREYAYYRAFAEGHEPDSVHHYADDGSIIESVVTDADKFTWYDGPYKCNVTLPGFLHRNGLAQMILQDDAEGYIALSVTRWEQETYVFHVSIIQNGKDHYFIVDSDLKQYYPKHWSEKVIREQNEELAQCQDTVKALVKDALAIWTFIE